MNDETKELIRDCNELLNDEIFTLNNIEITRHELNLLLDYITNLQQELETKQYDINNLTYQLAKEKSRIEKTVDYIKIHTFQEEIGFDNKKGKIHYGYFVECKAKDLLNILNGKE